MWRHRYLLLAGLFLCPAPALGAHSGTLTAGFSMVTTGYESGTANNDQGTAPLGIVVDAASTDGASLTQHTDASVREFHDLFYYWDFGDPSAGTWTYGNANADKNVALGPIAAHLYTTPGSYTVTLTVCDDQDQCDTATDSVTVDDPLDVFAPADTYCYANTAGTFTGCPLTTSFDGDDGADGTCSGTNSANCITTSNMSSVNGNIAANTWHLLAEDDAFETGGTDLNLTSGSGLVSTFGSGARPTMAGEINFAGSQNWTAEGLELDGGGCDPCNALDSVGSVASEFTFYDMYFHDLTAPASIQNNIHQEILLQDLLFTDEPMPGSSWNWFLACSDCAAIGIDSDQTTAGEGAVRLMHWERSVFSNNRMRGHDATHNPITVRDCNPAWAGSCTLNVSDPDHSVISDNVIQHTNSSTLCFTIKDGDNLHTTVGFIHDFIVENNYCECDVASCATTPAFIGRAGGNPAGADFTVRNNVLNGEGYTGNNAWFLNASGTNNDLGDNWHLYNNVYYDADGNGGGEGTVTFANPSQGSGHILRNNLIFAPDTTTITLTASGTWSAETDNLVDDPSAASSCRTTDASDCYCATGQTPTCDPFIDPSTGKNAAEDFALNSGLSFTGTSPIDTGFDFGTVDAHVYLDVFGNCRPENTEWDVGAHEVGAGTSCIPVSPTAIFGGSLGGGIQ